MMKDYEKQLFKQEYRDLITHYNELRWFMFVCTNCDCSSDGQLELMALQLATMQKYIDILNQRAYFEEIDI